MSVKDCAMLLGRTWMVFVDHTKYRLKTFLVAIQCFR